MSAMRYSVIHLHGGGGRGDPRFSSKNQIDIVMEEKNNDS